MVATVVWLSLTPTPPQAPFLLDWDKAQHFIAYAGLMYWYRMCFVRHWRWPAFLVCLGIGLEFLQGLGGVRYFEVYDMISNTLGVMGGWVIASTPAGKLLETVDSFLARGLDR